MIGLRKKEAATCSLDGAVAASIKLVQNNILTQFILQTLQVWNMHQPGDYFQNTLYRHPHQRHPHQSYTAMFHDAVRQNRMQVNFIGNIYSTSELPWLNMGYHIYPPASAFWEIQVTGGLAEYIADEQRFNAIF